MHKLQKMMSTNKMKQDGESIQDEEGAARNMGDCSDSKPQHPHQHPGAGAEADWEVWPAGASSLTSHGCVDADGLASLGPPSPLEGEVLFKGPSTSKSTPHVCMLDDGELSYRRMGKRKDNLVIAVSELEDVSVIAPLTLMVTMRGGSGRNSITFRLQNAEELYTWSTSLRHHIAHANLGEAHGGANGSSNGSANASANGSSNGRAHNSSSPSHGIGGTGDGSGGGSDANDGGDRIYGGDGDQRVGVEAMSVRVEEDEESGGTGEALLDSNNRAADAPLSSVLPKTRLVAEDSEAGGEAMGSYGQEAARSVVSSEGEAAREMTGEFSRGSPVAFVEERQEHEVSQRRVAHDSQLRWLLDEEIRCMLKLHARCACKDPNPQMQP